MPPSFRNWNGSQKCFPCKIEYPRTTQEIKQVVQMAAKSGKRIRVVGRGVHTYGYISMCDPDDIILNLQYYNQVLIIDKETKTVTAQAGIALEDLLPHLESSKVRLALRNMGEITEQCLGGVTGTGTHGSGGGGPDGQPDSFSDQVLHYKIMECTNEAKIHTVSQGSSDFAALQTHLGTLAIILEVTIQLVDWYHLEWKTSSIGSLTELTTDRILERYHQVYSLSYTYFPMIEEVVEVTRDKTNNTTESGIGADIQDDFVSTLRQGANRCLLLFPGFVKPYAKVQKRALLTLKGSDMWRKVLSQGDLWGGTNITLITDLEYAMHINRTIHALKALRQVFCEYANAKSMLAVVGIRFVRASPALMACHYSSNQEDIFAYINVQFRTKRPNATIVQTIQARMMELGGRPHWGKYNTTTRKMIDENRLWPTQNIKGFLEVKQKYDPHNLLGNQYLDRALGLDDCREKTTGPPSHSHQLRSRKSSTQISPTHGRVEMNIETKASF